jgi:hypothetical protein
MVKGEALIEDWIRGAMATGRPVGAVINENGILMK